MDLHEAHGRQEVSSCCVLSEADKRPKPALSPPVLLGPLPFGMAPKAKHTAKEAKKAAGASRVEATAPRRKQSTKGPEGGPEPGQQQLQVMPSPQASQQEQASEVLALPVDAEAEMPAAAAGRAKPAPTAAKQKATAAKTMPAPAKQQKRPRDAGDEPEEALPKRTIQHMLTNLRYQAGHHRDVEVKTLANRALELWKESDQQARRGFLDKWVQESKGKKGAGALKFVLNWSERVEHTESTTMKVDDSMIFPGQVLNKVGRTPSEFPTEEALRAFVHKACMRNADEAGHDGAHSIDPEDYMLSRYRWVTTDNSKLFNTSIVKTGAREASGLEAAGSASASLQILDAPAKEEHPGFETFQKLVKEATVVLGSLQRLVPQAESLAAKAKVKARKDPVFGQKEKEICQAIEVLQGFVRSSLDSLAEWEAADPASGDPFESALPEAMIAAAHHHSGGFKESLRRFTALF